jgi:4-amino-4-deoxy-L-arabinose transferase-like glycosyltransferase
LSRIVFDSLLRFRIELVALVVFGFVALAPGITQPPLLDWDEATYAEVAHEAVNSRSYLDFTWNGNPYLKKPPLLFWMMAASFKAFGENEFAARLPSMLLGLGTLILIYLSAAYVAGRLAGIFAGLTPLGFYFFVARGGRECSTDAPLVFFSTLALYALLHARGNRRWLPVAGAACGLAILSKGIAGLIPLTVVTISILAIPGFASIGVNGLILILGAAATVAAPWYVYQAVFNWSLFWSMFVKQETLLRVASHLEDERRSASYSLQAFCGEIRILWPVLIPFAALAFTQLRHGVRATLQRIPPAIAVWIMWMLLALGAACVVQTKLGWYVLPALIPVAMLAGSILGRAFTETGPARLTFASLAGVALLIFAIEVPGRMQVIADAFRQQHDFSRPSYFMALRARQLAARLGGGELYFAGVELPTLVYYSRMRCHFVASSRSGSLDPGFELTDAQGATVSLNKYDLVLVTPDGQIVPVTNLGKEWEISGPGATGVQAPRLED